MATGDEKVQDLATTDQVHDITIKAPLDAVWREITRVGSLQKPMFNTVLEATFEQGSRILYRGDDGKHVFIIGEVVDCQPPRRLVHTFRFTAMDEDPTLVTWDLTETHDGAHVTVSHTHFVNQAVTHKSVLTGWPTILSNYRAVLENGNVPLGTRIKHGFMQAFAFMMPSGTRTEAAAKLSTSITAGRR